MELKSIASYNAGTCLRVRIQIGYFEYLFSKKYFKGCNECKKFNYSKKILVVEFEGQREKMLSIIKEIYNALL